jgi:hypothetical protein
MLKTREYSDNNQSSHMQESDSDYEESTSNPEEVLGDTSPEGIKVRKSPHLRLKYDDVWKIYAGLYWAEAAGKPLPEVIVWAGDGYRLQDALPTKLFGPRWTGSKNKTYFSKIADIEVQMHILRQHTHWGYKLQEMCNEDQYAHSRVWARILRKRLRWLLAGKPDPLWNKEELGRFWPVTNELRDPKARAERLIELLKTVDGIFTQRYLCYPEESWSWEKYDLMILQCISWLIGDEFFDGEISERALDIDSAYSQLKRGRKTFKRLSHRGLLNDDLDDHIKDVAPWVRSLFSRTWMKIGKEQGQRYNFLIGICSQTRAAGTPPYLVLLQSKRKFLLTVSSEPIQRNSTQESLIENSLEHIIDMLPKEAFTGLATKARITVSTSACWEQTKRSGGTIEEIKEIVRGGEAGHQIPILDLETGEELEWKSMNDFSSPGEYIFWKCLDQVLRTPPDELCSAFLTVVKEPGKGRSVTKARACLKVVLDLINRICAEPMKKGIRSSQSGMGQSHHGWNFFLRMMTEEMKEELFSVSHRDQVQYEGYVERTDTFEDLFMSSTDYEEATDQMDHTFSSLAAAAWMEKCGIPALLRGIVERTCYQPRYIYFHGRGALSSHGEPAPEYGEHTRRVLLRKGVLMGDPLTKIILHLTNIVSRDIGTHLHQASYLRGFSNAEEAAETYRRSVEDSYVRQHR